MSLFRETTYRGRRVKHWVKATAISVSIVLMFTLIIGAIIAGVAWGDRTICRNKADNLDLPYRWSMSAGCLVRVDGRLIPIDQLRVTYVA